MHGTQFQLISSAYDGPMFFLSLSAFVLFLNLECNKRTYSLLVKMAPYTFGVYLIHENLFVSRRIWEIVIPDHFVLGHFLTCILTCSAIFMTAILVDYIRKRIFDFAGVEKAINVLIKRLPDL